MSQFGEPIRVTSGQYSRESMPRDSRNLATVVLSFVLLAAAILGLASCGSSKSECVLPPSISSLSPNAMTAGSPQFTLSVKGDNFFSASVLRWNGGDRQTTVVSASELTAVILPSDIANPGTAEIKVTTPFTTSENVMCAGDSNSLGFTINP
jgi:hypothetical protein